jgi:hypothetical protein
VNLEAKPSENSDNTDDNEDTTSSFLSVRNASANVSSVSSGGSIELTAEANASDSISNVTLATNESGSMSNVSTKESGFTDTDGDGFNETSFTWSNGSISGETIEWKITFQTSNGSKNSTIVNTIKIKNEVSKPTVSILPPEEINKTNVSLRGNLTDTGGSSVELQFNITSNSSIGLKDVESRMSSGIFSFDLYDLEPATEYNYTVIAENSKGSDISQEHSFVTESIIIDDFEDSSLTEYRYDDNGNPNPFDISGDNPLEGSNSLVAKDHWGTRALVSTSGLEKYPSRGNNISFIWEDRADSYGTFYLSYYNRSRHYRINANKRDSMFSIFKRKGGSRVKKNRTQHSFSNNQPYLVKIQWGNKIKAAVYKYDISTDQKESKQAEVTLKDTEYNSTDIGFGSGGDGTDVLNIWDRLKIS